MTTHTYIHAVAGKAAQEEQEGLLWWPELQCYGKEMAVMLIAVRVTWSKDVTRRSGRKVILEYRKYRSLGTPPLD